MNPWRRHELKKRVKNFVWENDWQFIKTPKRQNKLALLFSKLCVRVFKLSIALSIIKCVLEVEGKQIMEICARRNLSLVH